MRLKFCKTTFINT